MEAKKDELEVRLIFRNDEIESNEYYILQNGKLKLGNSISDIVRIICTLDSLSIMLTKTLPPNGTPTNLFTEKD